MSEYKQDFESTTTFSNPSALAKNLGIDTGDADKLSKTRGPATQYLKSNTFGFFGVNKKIDKNAAGNITSFMNNFSMMTPDNYDSNVARSRRHRQMFLNAVTKPKQFLEAKSEVANQLEDNVKKVRDELFVTLVGFDIEPVKARRDADVMAKGLLDNLINYLNTELFPSEIEKNIKQAALSRGGIKEVE